MEVKFRELNTIMAGTEALYHEAAKRLGVSDVELLILYVLTGQDGACPQRDLYKETGISRSTVNSAIKKMEKDGSVTLRALDGRSTEIKLTEKGRKLSQRTAEKIIEIENRIYESWTESDRRMMIRLNREFITILAAEVEKL